MMPLENTRQFIKVIQSKPALWDPNLKEYNDKVTRQAAWEEVANILYEDWNEFDENDQLLKRRDIQKKWKGLRDYFTRLKNKELASTPDDRKQRKRKTPFLDMLSFLNEATIKNYNRPTQPANTNLQLIITPKTLSSTAEEKSMPTVVQKRMFHTMSADAKQNDSDFNFLLSILPDMKSMDQNQNFEFRYQVMTLIKNIRYSQPNTENYYTSEGPSFLYQLPTEEPRDDIEVDCQSIESEASEEDVKFILSPDPGASQSRSPSP